MGIFYSISINELAYKNRKYINEILETKNVEKIIYYKNQCSFYIVNQSNYHQDLCSTLIDIKKETNISVITDISDLPFTSSNTRQDIIILKNLNTKLSNKLTLDKNLTYDDVKFEQDDIKMMECLLNALFYNVYNDNLPYDRSYLQALSYVSMKTIKTKSTNSKSIREKLVRACLQNWYDKYENYKKDLYNSYQEYFKIVKQITDCDDISFLKKYEPLSFMSINKEYIYFVNLYLKDMKKSKYANKSYYKYLTTDMEFQYKDPKYTETNYEQIYNLSKGLIEVTRKLLSVIDFWILLYHIQNLSKGNMIKNIFVYVTDDTRKYLIYVFDSLGFQKFV